MIRPIHLTQGLRYFSTSLRQKCSSPTRYPGSAEDICKAIVTNCWNGHYFMTSTHHYREFWSRDFGYCVEGLLRLGYHHEVQKSLHYALERFERGGIRTTISPGGHAFSFPALYSPDSVALFFHALRASHADELCSAHDAFLQRELDTYARTVLDDGRIRRGTHFGGMRDHARHDSSCYNHCMSILLAREAKKLGFDFPYTERELVRILGDYWTGSYYRDDRAHDTPSGDANALPFWLGAGKHFSRVLKTLQEEQLDTPVPLAYSSHTETHMHFTEAFVPGWQHRTLWPFLGLIWMQAAKKHKPGLAQRYKQQFAELIERDGTLYEVYTPDGKPYQSLFYHADEGMLWASMWLGI